MDTFDDEFLDDDELEEERVPTKEQLVFLIDAQQSMLQPCNHPDEELAGCTWLQLAVKVAAEVLRQKVIQCERDEVAVVFYDTREVSQETGENVVVLQSLDEPDVGRIQELQDVSASMSKLESRIGSKGERSGQAFRSALTLAASMLRERSKQQRATRRVLVFTTDDHPVEEGQARTSTLKSVESLHEQRAALQLFPMARRGEGRFDLAPFWSQALALTRNDGETEYEEEEQVGRIDDLRTTLRSRAYKKRALSSLLWRIGAGLELGVQLFAMVQPARKAAYSWVEAETLEEVKTDIKMIDNFTGAILEPKVDASQQPRTFFPNPRQFASARFPQVFVSLEELRGVKAVQPAGLTLLGFKPLKALRDYHQLRNSTFIYPDEKSVSGSTAAFACLHHVLLEEGSWALCSFSRNRYSEPRLVALLPQQATEEDPTGFQMIFLPYADDIRGPEADRNFTGVQRPEISKEQVSAAEAMLGVLELGEFSSGGVANPHLQRHYQVLESLALHMEPPAIEDFVDETEPQGLDDPEAAAAIQRFKDAVYGKGYIADVSPVKGTKRKASADNADLAAEVEALDIPGKAAKGKLGTLTVAKLQLYLELKSLPRTGRKEELVARITNHLAKGG